MTPEAKDGGGILYLQTGDLLYLNFRGHSIEFLDQAAFRNGEVCFSFDSIKSTRHDLGEERLLRIKQRQKLIAASNRMLGHTDAAYGVVPLAVSSDADLDYHVDVNIPNEKQKNS
jgi:dihydroxyacid dehydratase/phosphogluconate dehydratase